MSRNNRRGRPTLDHTISVVVIETEKLHKSHLLFAIMNVPLTHIRADWSKLRFEKKKKHMK